MHLLLLLIHLIYLVIIALFVKSRSLKRNDGKGWPISRGKIQWNCNIFFVISFFRSFFWTKKGTGIGRNLCILSLLLIDLIYLIFAIQTNCNNFLHYANQSLLSRILRISWKVALSYSIFGKRKKNVTGKQWNGMQEMASGAANLSCTISP